MKPIKQILPDLLALAGIQIEISLEVMGKAIVNFAYPDNTPTLDLSKPITMGFDEGSEAPAEVVVTWGYKTKNLTNEQLSEATQHLTEYTKRYFEFIMDNPGPVNPPDDKGIGPTDNNFIKTN